MDKKKVLTVLKKAREGSKKRNFNQRVDFILNLKEINLKKSNQQLDVFISLPHGKGKKTKVCALVGPELIENAKKNMDKVVLVDDFPNYAKKSDVKKLANQFDFFIAQVTIMPKVAATFGRVLGVRGKMPNPKAGCVVSPKANLKVIYDNLQNLVRVQAKIDPLIQVVIGSEEMSDEELAENLLTLYNSIWHALPKEKNNIKDMFIKTTMGKPVLLEAN